MDYSAEHTGELSKIRLHAADLGTNTQEQDTLQSLSKKNVRNIQEIEAAIERLHSGDFGICELCKKPISIDRLRLLPETRFCLACQQETETMKSHIDLEHLDNTPQYPSAVTEFLHGLKVSDVMSENPVALYVSESLLEASKILDNCGFRHLPVIDDDGNIQGIISDRDMLRLLVEKRPWKAYGQMENYLQKYNVRSVMTKPPETVAPDDSLASAGTVMLENKISCLPVVEGNRLVGILTESDYVRLCCTGHELAY